MLQQIMSQRQEEELLSIRYHLYQETDQTVYLPLLVLGVLTAYHFSTSCLPVTVATGMLTNPT